MKKLPAASNLTQRAAIKLLEQSYAENENEKLKALLDVTSGKPKSGGVTALTKLETNSLLATLDDFTKTEKNGFEIFSGDAFSIPITLARHAATGTSILISS